METNNIVNELKKEAKDEPMAAETVPDEKIEEQKNAPDAPRAQEVKPGRTLQEMLEKNLKWSQIIYEQNRRISRRLLWTMIIGWVKWILLGAVIILSLWYIWPVYRTFQAQYSAIMNQVDPSKPLDKAGLQKVLQMLPLNSSSQEQIKAMLK